MNCNEISRRPLQDLSISNVTSEVNPIGNKHQVYKHLYFPQVILNKVLISGFLRWQYQPATKAGCVLCLSTEERMLRTPVLLSDHQSFNLSHQYRVCKHCRGKPDLCGVYGV